MSRRFQQTGLGAFINWSHPIAQLVQPELVCVADGTTKLFDVVRGQLGSPAGNPTTDVIPAIQTVWVGDGAADRVDFSGRPTLADRDITLACVLRSDVAPITSDFALTTSSSTNAGFRLAVTFDSNLSLTKGAVVDISSGIPIPGQVPYFAAASYQNSTGDINFILVDLDTFVTLTATANNTDAEVAGDGTYGVGGGSVFSGGVNWQGGIAFAAFGRNFVSMDILKQWALDPYCFLRRQIQPRVFFIPAAPAVTRRPIIIVDMMKYVPAPILVGGLGLAWVINRRNKLIRDGRN